MKKEVNSQDLLARAPPCLTQAYQYIRKLDETEIPEYDRIRSMFTPNSVCKLQLGALGTWAESPATFSDHDNTFQQHPTDHLQTIEQTVVLDIQTRASSDLQSWKRKALGIELAQRNAESL
jgi:hypothetical protein